MVKFNPKLKKDVEYYLGPVMIVEGKKDVEALNSLGFEKVYAIHQTSVPLKERVVQITAELDRKDKVCILTDFDKKGKKLYLMLKEMFQEQGVKLDSTLRGILIKAQISHVEGIDKFMEKIDKT